MRINKTILIMLAILLVILLPIAVGATANVPYTSYNYNFWQQMVPAPQAYVPTRALSGIDLGVGSFNTPQDLFVAPNGEIYVVDTGNSRIICMNENFELLRVIDEFQNNGQPDRLNKPSGIFVRANGWMYIADEQNERVVVLDRQGKLLYEVTSPAAQEEGLFSAEFKFRPQKVGVDNFGRIYVIARNVYDGIMEFTVDGEFRGFIGAPRVTPTLVDYIWRRIGTKEQKERMLLFLPVEHSNMDIDERGFIYATVIGGAVQENEKIRRLNTSGDNVLRMKPYLPPIGDYVVGSVSPSTFVDVAAREYGIYSVLDRIYGRIFTYDIDGNLLYVFGGMGEQLGTFWSPIALDCLGDHMLVLDAAKNQITVFAATDYQRRIHAGIGLYNRGRYDEAAQQWKSILRYNANFDLGYTGIGKALFLQGEHKEAMNNFRLANNRPDYSKAYRLYRKEVIGKNFGWIMLVLLLVVVFAVVLTSKKPEESVAAKKEKIADLMTEVQEWEAMEKRSWRVRLKRIGRALQYSLYVIFHPFDGFWDLKHEKRGNLPAATMLLTMVVLTYVFIRQYTGFIFNQRNLKELNILLEIFSVIFPFFLWTTINWSLTTLMEGKGSFKDIVIASAYALTPIILINIPLTVVSNFLLLEEGAFYYFFFIVSIVWAVALLIFGTMVTHDYDLPKTILVTILILIGIGIALFIGLVFMDMFNQFLGFIADIYAELTFRL